MATGYQLRMVDQKLALQLELALVLAFLGAGELLAEGVAMRAVENRSPGEHVYEGAIPCAFSGRHGYAIRVVPSYDDPFDRYDQGLITWG